MSAAERQRRYRRNQRAGLVVAPVPMTYDGIAFLTEAGVLRVEDEDDRVKIGEAAAKLLESLANGGDA